MHTDCIHSNISFLIYRFADTGNCWHSDIHARSRAAVHAYLITTNSARHLLSIVLGRVYFVYHARW